MKNKIFIVFIFFFSQCLFASSQLPSVSAIASASPLATHAGFEILSQGGNAFDAAVAVSAALAVVEPYHSGLGGGGFWLLHDAKKNNDIVINGRERAPLSSSPNMFLDNQGHPIDNLSIDGPLSAAIPGEVAALVYMQKHYGKLPLSVSLAPAIALAKNGFPVDTLYQKFAQFRLEALQKSPDAAKIFLYQNDVPPLGYKIIQPALANTLIAIAKYGNDGFYKGPIADQLINDIQKNKGIWSLKDLANYRIEIQAPLKARYQNFSLTTVPLPSAGGIGLITMLNILSGYDLKKYDKVTRDHLIIEAMRMSFWDRAKFLGDDVTSTQKLTTLDHAKHLRGFISLTQATTSDTLPAPDIHLHHSHHTTHFSILDTHGNRVAATLSINYIFGSGFVSAGTGVLFNDEMDDFSIKPGVKNVFGLIGNTANSIAPGKRPLSSMCPLFLENKNGLAILGTPGGSRIATMMLLATLDVAEGNLPLSWVSLPRFHHQYFPDVVEYETNAFSKDEMNQLKRMGYTLKQKRDPYGNMQAIFWDKKNNQVFAASDPRGLGGAYVGSQK